VSWKALGEEVNVDVEGQGWILVVSVDPKVNLSLDEVDRVEGLRKKLGKRVSRQ
jgi:hypothetical protein